MNATKEVMIAMTTPHVQIPLVHTTVLVIRVILEMGHIVKVGLSNKDLLGRCSQDILIIIISFWRIFKTAKPIPYVP